MQEDTTDKKEESGFSRFRNSFLGEAVKTVACAIVLALFIRTFVLATFFVPSASMKPTLVEGDRLVALICIYGFPIPFTGKRLFAMTEPHRGDVIIFNSTDVEGLDEGKNYIKRLVGLGGERLSIARDESLENRADTFFRSVGRVHIDGESLEEPPGVAEKQYVQAGKYGTSEVTVPPDHYFMLGDNVRNSLDSRYWGFLPRGNVIGRAVLIYWPPSRMGLIRS
jgi:signal peptidase I